MTDDEQDRTALWTVLWILALVLFIVILAGCASSFQGICGVVGMGQNDSGVAFVRVRCEAME